MLPCLEQRGCLTQEALSDVARSNKRKRDEQEEDQRLEFDPDCQEDSQLIEHLNWVFKARDCYCLMCRAVREHADCECNWCVKTRDLQTQLVRPSCA